MVQICKFLCALALLLAVGCAAPGPGSSTGQVESSRSTAQAAAVAPVPAPALVLAWSQEWPTDRPQVFQFIACADLAQPQWVLVTNVLGAAHTTGEFRVALPREWARQFVTIGATWFVDEPDNVRRWEGW